jgi:hypothetical protein
VFETLFQAWNVWIAHRKLPVSFLGPRVGWNCADLPTRPDDDPGALASSTRLPIADLPLFQESPRRQSCVRRAAVSAHCAHHFFPRDVLGPRWYGSKLASDPNNPVRFKDDATADELRAEINRRLTVLQEAGIIELQVIEAPEAQ